ncbi:MAG: hypothetical protein ACRCSB_06680 [Bacteroidales bacterium]
MNLKLIGFIVCIGISIFDVFGEVLLSASTDSMTNSVEISNISLLSKRENNKSINALEQSVQIATGYRAGRTILLRSWPRRRLLTIIREIASDYYLSGLQTKYFVNAAYTTDYTVKINNRFDIGARLLYTNEYAKSYLRTGELTNSYKMYQFGGAMLVRLIYLHKRNSIKIYGDISFGCVLKNYQLQLNTGKNRRLAAGFMGHVNYLGVSFGRTIYGFGDFGFGSKGIISAGIGYRFQPKTI